MAVALAASPGQAVPAVPAGGFGMPTPVSPVNEAIVAGDLDAAERLTDLGDRYVGQHALADAEAAFRGALAIFEAALGPADPQYWHFMVEAKKYQVLPLDNSILERILTPRPSATAGRNEFTYYGEVSGIPSSSAPNPLTRSYSITAEVEVPAGGGEGMLNTLGGRFGGYGLYLVKGKPVYTYDLLGLEKFRWAGKNALTPGKHTIMFDFKYDGPGMAKGGTGVLSVDGKEVDNKKIPHTIPSVMTIDESFDVGVDTRTGVEDKDYQPPFRFTGKLDKLTIKLGPGQLTEDDYKVMHQYVNRANDEASD